VKLLDKMQELPGVTYDRICYCYHRYVLRSNGVVTRTELTLIRTPEQQAALEALQSWDKMSNALTEAARRFESFEDPETIVVRSIIEGLTEEIVANVVFAGAAELAEARNLEKIRLMIGLLEQIESSTGPYKDAWKLFSELRDRQEAFEAYLARAKEALAAREVWLAAVNRANQVPNLDHILKKPFTLTFTNRAGERVAIVTRSIDGVTRSVSPLDPVAIDRSWDGTAAVSAR